MFGCEQCRTECALSAVRVAVHVDCGPRCRRDRVDDGRDILVLALQRVDRSVAAGPAPAAIHDVDRRMRLQVREQRREALVDPAVPWTSSSGGPSPLVQTAISVPSVEVTCSTPQDYDAESRFAAALPF